MHTPMRPGTGASEPEDTPVEEFAADENVPADYTGSDDPKSKQAAQRPTGSGGGAAPRQARPSGPPE